MKLFGTFLFLILSFELCAQWDYTTNAPKIFYNGGNVGIGVSNPSQALEVKGNIRIDGTSGFNHSELAFYRADGTKFASIGQGDLSVANSTFDFQHYNGNDIRFLNVGVEHLRISSSNGFIGVGIASPSGQLHVASNNNHAIKLTRSNGLYGFQILRNASQGIIYFQNTDDNNVFGTRIRMEEGGANWQNLLLNPDAGNVGIGTISPSTKLHVNGALRIDGASGGVVGTGNGSRIHLSSGSATSIEENWGINIIGADDAPVKIRNSALLVGYTSASAGWGTSGNLLVQGNVGIGTTTPDAKLAVKGNIHTQEVKVDLAGAVAPDYVFETDYDLPSLSEVETYINQHKHLPEVPSAKQMEEEGLNLKEMNLILLKKVEELTLHLIEQNKINEQQKEINQNLVTEINVLKAKQK